MSRYYVSTATVAVAADKRGLAYDTEQVPKPRRSAERCPPDRRRYLRMQLRAAQDDRAEPGAGPLRRRQRPRCLLTSSPPASPARHDPADPDGPGRAGVGRSGK